MAESAIEWLQRWYAEQCDGDWEHQQGVEIGTLDNPGWRLRVDLSGTSCGGHLREREVIERSADDWVQSWVEDDRFHAAGGPMNLGEMIETFRVWTEGRRF